MNLVQCSPNSRLSRRSQNRLSLFDDFFSPFSVHDDQPGFYKSGNMKVDIFEKDNAVIIEAELPGVAKDDITVNVKGKHVTLGGERKSNKEITTDNFYRREREYGKFERTFNLAFDIKVSDVKAEFKDGILELEIPKPKEQVKQSITIN